MRRSRWLKLVSVVVLFQLCIITSTSLSLSSLSNSKGSFDDESNLLEAHTEKTIVTPLDNEETVGDARIVASFYFPIFPQFYNLDYNSVWNFLKSADTIGYFVLRDVSAVSKVIM